MASTTEATNSFLQASSTLDSALLFVVAAFVLNVIVVIVAFCYFDPAPYDPPLLRRTYHTLRRISRAGRTRKETKSESPSPSTHTVLFV